MGGGWFDVHDPGAWSERWHLGWRRWGGRCDARDFASLVRGQQSRDDREGDDVGGVQAAIVRAPDERGGALRRLPLELPMTVRAVGIAVPESGEPSPDLRVVLEALRRAAGSGVDRQNEYLVRAS